MEMTERYEEIVFTGEDERITDDWPFEAESQNGSKRSKMLWPMS